MSECDKIYCKIMSLWIAERKQLIVDCRNSAHSARIVADLNDRQAKLHEKTFWIGKRQFDDYMKRVKKLPRQKKSKADEQA